MLNNSPYSAFDSNMYFHTSAFVSRRNIGGWENPVYYVAFKKEI